MSRKDNKSSRVEKDTDSLPQILAHPSESFEWWLVGKHRHSSKSLRPKRPQQESTSTTLLEASRIHVCQRNKFQTQKIILANTQLSHPSSVVSQAVPKVRVFVNKSICSWLLMGKKNTAHIHSLRSNELAIHTAYNSHRVSGARHSLRGSMSDVAARQILTARSTEIHECNVHLAIHSHGARGWRAFQPAHARCPR